MDAFNELFGPGRGQNRKLEDEVVELLEDRAPKNGSGATARNIARALGCGEEAVLEALETAQSEFRTCRDGSGRWHPLKVPSRSSAILAI